MERYQIDSKQLQWIEHAAVPMAIYQFVDRRVVTLALSDGFCELFGFDDMQEAYYVMDHDMYRDAHPDDRARIANIALRFATEGGEYSAVYRSKGRDGNYFIVHALGRHFYAPTGERLAMIWYADEGPYTPEGAVFETRLSQSFNRALRENTILHENRFDTLTGLPGMTYFFELADAARKRILAAGKQMSVLFFDLSGMKLFNRNYGFAEGDKLIRAVAEQLADCFGHENCSRFAQDHFAVYIERSDTLDRTLDALLARCKTINDGKALPVRVGIYPDVAPDVEISNACDRAKGACDTGRKSYVSGYRYFDESIVTEAMHRQYLLDHLDRAIEERWIEVYYQPIIRAANGDACNEEALARWVDPERGVLSPAQFIPVLEDAALIYKLDLCVLEQVLARLKGQSEHGIFVVPISINLSRSDFDACDIVEEFRKRVDAAGLPRDKINIEITESVIGSDFDFMKTQIERFRALGFHVWMDDFGSGYSSIDLLQRIEFDLIKFDMSFMQNFDKGEHSRVILTELMKMALAVGIDTVVEGVETREQVDFLLEIGATKLQGFYYTRPLSLAQLLRHNEDGLHLEFENPAEADYYAAVGRVNLYNPSIDLHGGTDAYNHYFDAIPMAVHEVQGDETFIMRCNRSYREMLQRVLHMEPPEDSVHNIRFDQMPEQDFFDAVQQSVRTGEWVQFERQVSNEFTIHSFIRCIAVNPVTGAIAVSNIVLPMRYAELAAVDAETDAYFQISANSVARALASDYVCIYCINTETNSFRAFTHSSAYARSNYILEGEDFFATVRKDADKAVHPDDLELFMQFNTKELLLAELEKHSAFTLTYRMLIEGKPHYVLMKATRMRDRRNGILIGVSDIDAQIRQREEYERARRSSLTYAHIAQALSKDYVNLYYVDIETERFITYSSHNAADDLTEELQSESFFATARAEALQRIYPEDQARFLEVFTKESILYALKVRGVFTLTYRLLVDGQPAYFNMKASRMEGDDRHIIIGVSSVDAQMRHQEAMERVKEERITYARITALSGDYIAIYTVDPVTDHYTEYSATQDYAGLGLAKEGDDFFGRAATDGTRMLYFEDLDLYLTALTKENVLRAIERNGFFALTYRLMIDGEPTYVNLKIGRIEEKDGPQLIVGVQNINEQVKRDQEYARNLSVERNKANFDALTGVKNKHAYIDVEARLNHQIEEREGVEFALAVCDINDLKTVNDTQGHQAGDRYLQRARTILCRNFKNSPVFRVGGDEFAVLMQGQDYLHAEEQVAALQEINRRNAAAGDIVIACGLARYAGDRNVAAVFERADRSMYANKHELKTM